mmetsp:Transcript_13726/g.32518  ORF Transcript_13726/g.32518 Transcript_13726/m.32518 type:complete len:252 (-) Transcript_13726:96-851(-)
MTVLSRTLQYCTRQVLLRASSTGVRASTVLPSTLSSIVLSKSTGATDIATQPVLREFIPFAARGVSSKSGEHGKSDNAQQQQQDSLVGQEEPFDTITDRIPEKPVGVVEGTSYSLVIFAGLALAGATVWAVVKELLLEPKEYMVFNKTLEYIKSDPRVTVRLGESISGYGADSRNRSARQRIPNRIYTDSNGVEHVQVQFQAKGSGGGATVHADMYADESKQWQYSYLYVDVDAPYPQRLVLVSPQYAAAG